MLPDCKAFCCASSARINSLIVPLQVDWKAEENRPVKPNLLGTKAYKNYAVKDVVDYIDWNPFFQVSGSIQCFYTSLDAFSGSVHHHCLISP